MGTKTKIAMTVIPVLIVAIILVNLVFGLIFHNFVLRSEKRQIDSSVTGISSYIQENSTKYSMAASDWGHWDDTYAYITDGNTGYIDVNMSENSFDYLDVSFIMILDKDEKLLYQRFYQQEKGRFTDFPAGFSEDAQHVIDFAKSASDVSGILKIGEAFYFVAATDVTDSLERTPANGTLIFGREICAGTIREMERVSGCSIVSIDMRENTGLQNESAAPHILEESFDKGHARSTVL